MAALAKQETRIAEQDVDADFGGERADAGARTRDGDRSRARRGA
jgi:hypothetical protein